MYHSQTGFKILCVLVIRMTFENAHFLSYLKNWNSRPAQKLPIPRSMRYLVYLLLFLTVLGVNASGVRKLWEAQQTATQYRSCRFGSQYIVAGKTLNGFLTRKLRPLTLDTKATSKYILREERVFGRCPLMQWLALLLLPPAWLPLGQSLL